MSASLSAALTLAAALCIWAFLAWALLYSVMTGDPFHVTAAVVATTVAALRAWGRKAR